MKFGTLLRDCAETVPEMASLHASYKQLKKQLKKCSTSGTASPSWASASSAECDPLAARGTAPPPQQQNVAAAHSAAAASAEALARPSLDGFNQREAEFVAALAADVPVLNTQFLDREEDAVIRMAVLQGRAAACTAAANRDGMQAVTRDLVNFHGELLLLQHWALVAYAAILKILKKHHKRTGHRVVIRDGGCAALADLLSQPFCSLECISEMITQVEVDVGRLCALLGLPSSSWAAPRQPTGQCSTGAASKPDPSASPRSITSGCSSASTALAAAALGACASAAAAPGRLLGKHAREEQAGGSGNAHCQPPATRPCTVPSTAPGEAGSAPAGAGAAPGNSVMQQTMVALGLWEKLLATAHTPSTVLPASTLLREEGVGERSPSLCPAHGT